MKNARIRPSRIKSSIRTFQAVMTSQIAESGSASSGSAPGVSMIDLVRADAVGAVVKALGMAQRIPFHAQRRRPIGNHAHLPRPARGARVEGMRRKRLVPRGEGAELFRLGRATPAREEGRRVQPGPGEDGPGLPQRVEAHFRFIHAMLLQIFRAIGRVIFGSLRE